MNAELIEQKQATMCRKVIFGVMVTAIGNTYSTSNYFCNSTEYAISTYTHSGKSSTNNTQMTSNELIEEMIEAGILCFHDHMAVLNA